MIEPFLQLSDYAMNILDLELGVMSAGIVAATGFLFKTWRMIGKLDKEIAVIKTWILTKFKIDLNDN